MGELMREYWLPAFMSSELAGPDGDPLRIRLLGESLLAFRSTSGKIGLVANNCPHRGASLFYGRNEEEGLRCVYHGWKFDVEGRCIDMPAEPLESNYKDEIKLTAYRCQERNGVVWAYMGSRKDPPALPDLEPNMLDGRGATVWTALRDCNWLQALEGDIDTAHLAILHLGGLKPDDMEPGTFDYYTVNDWQPRFRVTDTDCGTMYGAYRPVEDDKYYWRVAQFLFPFYTLIPTGALGVQINVRAWVPMDDEHTMFWNMMVPNTRSTIGSRLSSGGNGQPFAGSRLGPQFLPNTTDWFGRWRLAANEANDYLIDREVQRAESYTGIEGIHLQDQVITESMGPVYDRTQENLGSSDAMIVRTRRRLVRSAVEHREGTTPPGVDNPELYRQRSGGIILPRDADWIKSTEELRKAFTENPELSTAV
jgi:phenylpropionate dioxygenase-like ring-hydroxylating dioxygenase large terminal subunit